MSPYQRVAAKVDELGPRLIEVSHQIWEHPELCFEEHYAHDLLCEVLQENGLEPTRHAFGLDTAFVAEAGTTGPVVAVCCEYDALPEIGHACGHNVIAAAGLGAGLAAATIAQEAGGRVRILGCPAEEGGGGKVFMIRRGAFDDVVAAMMIHPADNNLATMRTLAIQTLEVRYHGVSSHAASAPHLGRNALDAAVLGYMNVAALRQHITPDERVHGIFTEAGDKPNIVPRSAAAIWYVRSPTMAGLAELKSRVVDCLSAGASAAGCQIEYDWIDPPYADLVDSEELLAAFERHASELGRAFDRGADSPEVVGSTDMGDVSHLVPSIHPMLAVAPPGVSIHTPDFAEHARGAGGDRAVIDGAKAMAATIVDCWHSPPVAIPGTERARP